MSKPNISKTLDELLTLSNETEWVEFKYNNADPKQIGEYISALANSAVIQRKEMAYMIWGDAVKFELSVGLKEIDRKIMAAEQALHANIQKQKQDKQLAKHSSSEKDLVQSTDGITYLANALQSNPSL